MSPRGFRWLNKKIYGITCSVSNTAENSAHTAALCNLLIILQKAYEAYLYRGILFVIHELRISLAVLQFVVLSPSIRVKFHCFSLSCVGSIPLFCFHCRGPLCQAPLSHQPHCSFACSIPFHSHSTGRLWHSASPALSAVLCVQNKENIAMVCHMYRYHYVMVQPPSLCVFE